MMRRMVAAGLVLAVAAAASAAEPLSVGDPAPKIQFKEFVKGDPVAGLDKGTVYVVEFWATWCGPCRTSIPHLTKLQKEHKDVVVIGVSVSERDFDKVKPFVEEMGDKMDYRVAIDSIPEGKKADDGAMNKLWMEAAEQGGIPTAFIVDKEGMIAWIGHPMKMDKPLADIVGGKWDLRVEAVKYKEEKAHEKKVQSVFANLSRGMRSGDLTDALASAEEAMKDDPKLQEIVPQMLYSLARRVVDPNRVKAAKPDEKQAKVALAAAAKAVELTGSKDANMLDTLAQAHFVAGDHAKAIEVQEKAVKLKPSDKRLKEHLDAFKEAKDPVKDKEKDKEKGKDDK